MATYVIGQLLALRDPERFAEYRSNVAETIERYGGRFLVRGGHIRPLEGDWHPNLVIVAFPSREQALTWYESPEYRPLLEQRRTSADMDVVMVDGV